MIWIYGTDRQIDKTCVSTANSIAIELKIEKNSS